MSGGCILTFFIIIMNIVVLDGYVANSGDLSWDELSQSGDLTVYDRTAPDQVVERALEAEAIFTNKVVIDKDIIARLPDLRFIGVLATGYNNVDIHAAREAGITVCNVPAYSTEAVVQTIFAHLLNITNRVQEHTDSVRRGDWTACADFCYRLGSITELSGLTMGIYGLGNIGKRVACVAHAFGMEVIALTTKMQWELPEYITPVSDHDLFAKSDVLVLCAPLTPDNTDFVNADTLSLMKPTAIVINTARGGMVDSQALARALDEGRIAAAGIDVLVNEPPMASEPLLTARNCYITPHYAWQSDAARRRLLDISASNLKAFIGGKPVNVVN